MKVSDYKPDIYENNLEMNVILNSEEEEFEKRLKLQIDNAFVDTFAETATITGIENFEKILDITANPITEDLELRRARVLNRLISQIPFTETFLKQQLDKIIGEGNWEYTINYNNYTLDINITTPGKTWLKELQDLFSKIIPCNIDWTINIFAASWQSVKDNFNTWQDVYDSEMTWQELLDGEWLS